VEGFARRDKPGWRKRRAERAWFWVEAEAFLSLAIGSFRAIRRVFDIQDVAGLVEQIFAIEIDKLGE